ncbi:hypothetical protein Hamer_G027991 [Homarus americanus]|uniref:Uncharacterized protein n=1 Tax=Homarus americanus TaxID=6706 RepID=A0A8J5K7S3_HOMAM|nr:hypothetical protein Hamer_G027991 [Homarus americanus]
MVFAWLWNRREKSLRTFGKQQRTVIT